MTKGTDDQGLLPCPTPWCDGEGELRSYGGFQVICQGRATLEGETMGCAVETREFATPEEAIAAWNTRPEAADRIEQLSSALEFYAAIGNHIMTIGRDKHGSRATSAIIKDGGEIARSALQSLQVGGE
jgi:hypothetical protein